MPSENSFFYLSCSSFPNQESDSLMEMQSEIYLHSNKGVSYCLDALSTSKNNQVWNLKDYNEVPVQLDIQDQIDIFQSSDLLDDKEDSENNILLTVPRIRKITIKRKDVSTYKERKKRVHIDSNVKSFVTKVKVMLENKYPNCTLKMIAPLLKEKVKERFPYDFILNVSNRKKNLDFDMLGLLYNLNRKPKKQ